jgi:LysR family cyn operon transcriptional activator
MPEPLDIRHLRYFLAVAEAGSFSRAADRLGISQPSISQQMRDLEAGLRVPLFQRRGKRILLTPRGLIFQEHARALLHQLENFLQDLNSDPGELRGALRLGVIPVLNVPLVPQLLGAFAADHPVISVTVEEISSTEIETALEEGRMDVGLGFLTRHSPNLRYERLRTDEFALVVAQNHPWVNRRVVDFSELHQQRVLQLPDTFVMRRMTDEICRKHQVRLHVIAEINAIETLLRSLRPLRAATLMPKIALRGRENLKLRAIRLHGKNLGVDIGLLRLSDSAANTAVAAFTNLAKATVPKMIKR